MTRIRRAVVLLGVTAAAFFGGMLPADAQYSNSAALPTMAITSVNVTAPASLSTAGTKCDSVYDATTGVTTTTLNAKLSWSASTTPRGVTGYVITAVFTDGTKYTVAQVGATTTSLAGSYDAYYASQNIRVTVTTLTSYGWTKESAQSGVIKC
jgi:hypothetical protein